MKAIRIVHRMTRIARDAGPEVTLNRQGRILNIGPHRESRGGIASVVRTYMEHATGGPLTVRDLATVNDSGVWGKAWIAMKAYVLAPFKMARADIVHIHAASRNSWRRKIPFVLLAHALRRKVIIHIHSGSFGNCLDSMGPWRRRFNLRVLRLADCVVCLSPRKLEEIASYLQGVRTVTIPNPCSHIPARAARREGPGVGILFTGWIVKEKGVFDLIRAFALLTKACPETDLSLVMAGKGLGKGDVESCKRLAHEVGIFDKVIFPGWLTGEALHEVYSRAHIYCLPSYIEGLPMAVLEAMASGLPLVTCPVGGIPDVVRHGVHGLFVDPGDTEGIAAALKRLVENPSEGKTMGDAGRDEVLSGYSIDKVGARVTELYRSLLTEPNGGART